MPAPRRSKLYIACSDFLQKSERAHAAAPPLQIEPAALGFDLVLGADLKAVPRKCSRFPRRGLRIVRDDFLYKKVIAHSLRRSSFPNRNGCAGLRFGFGSGTESLHLESVHAFHVGASCISLAPTFFKSQSALIPLLLLSKSNPLRWASIWFWVQT